MIFIQPSIDPVIFSLGFIDIRWYSLAYIFGLILGITLIKTLNKYYGNLVHNSKLDNFFIWAVVGVILGGRLGYILFYQTNLIFNEPLHIFQIWKGGMSFHGGLIGIILSCYFFCKLNRLSFLYLADLIALVSPIGIFLGRLANFINTELIGRPTDFYIAIIYPTIDSIPRHPSQLYEAIFEGFVLFVILIVYFFKNKNKKNYGFISGIFLLFYGTSRFMIEFLREPDSHIGLFFNIISMGQILSIPLVIVGIIFMLKYVYRKNN